jgi:membrane associated rhomboid family serine protease
VNRTTPAAADHGVRVVLSTVVEPWMYFFYFYPLGLDRKIDRHPLLTRLLTVVMLVAFVWLKYRPDQFSLDPYDLVFFPGNGAPWTAVTAIFLHGGWLHLAGNLIWFNVFGPPLENRLGPALFLLIFLMLGAFGNLVHGLVSAWGLIGKPGMGVLGASGALAGLLSFSLVRFYSARVRIGWWVFAPLVGQNKAGTTHLPILAGVLLWLLLQVVHALAAKETGSGVSYGAHLGGFVLGVVLALILGQLTEGKVETRLERAKRYFQQGEFHAAAGAWTEYLELRPADLQGILGRARTLLVLDQHQGAARDYRRALGHLVMRGDLSETLEVFREARRGGMTRTMPPDLLVKLATLMEKQMDYEGALAAYRELFETYPDHSAGHRALVRLVHLYHGKYGDQDEAARWLDIACRKLPGGSFREFLAREFNLAGASGAADSGGPAPLHPKTAP